MPKARSGHPVMIATYQILNAQRSYLESYSRRLNKASSYNGSRVGLTV